MKLVRMAQCTAVCINAQFYTLDRAVAAAAAVALYLSITRPSYVIEKGKRAGSRLALARSFFGEAI